MMFFKNACIKSLFKTIRELLKRSPEIKRTIRLEFQWYITFVKNKTDLIQNWSRDSGLSLRVWGLRYLCLCLRKKGQEDFYSKAETKQRSSVQPQKP